MALMFLLLALAIACLSAAVGAALSAASAKTRARRQLASAEARWALQQQHDSAGSVVEHVPFGWLNTVLQALWAPVLEKHLAGLTAELLGKVFAEVWRVPGSLSCTPTQRAWRGVLQAKPRLHRPPAHTCHPPTHTRVQVLAKNGSKAPFKFLDSIAVEELSFGIVPPTFHAAAWKHDAAAAMLTLSTDVRFTSSSAQAVVSGAAAAVHGLCAWLVCTRLAAAGAPLRASFAHPAPFLQPRHAQLLVRSRAVGLLFAPLTIRFEATHVKLRGRLRLGIQLGPEPPGIQ
jgi:hypothetical protein